MTVVHLWESKNQDEWKSALENYWAIIPPKNLPLEHEIANLSPNTVKNMDKNEFYEFLLNKYFKWFYTAPNRYATTTKKLKNYELNSKLDQLCQIKERLFQFDKKDIKTGLKIAKGIGGLGPLGATGLLAILFPLCFGTVAQYTIEALKDIQNVEEKERIAKMNPKTLKISDCVLLITLMRNKSETLNRLFQTDFWTPRKIDMILWSQR